MPRIHKIDDDPKMKMYYYACFKMMGKKLDSCWRCGKRLHQRNKHLHHNKYDGATIHDLEILCTKCHCTPQNWHLV